jgi:hypothetical protein
VEGIDEMRMPFSFAEERDHGMSGGFGLSEGLKYEAHGNGEDNQAAELDRRIPMIPRIKGAGNTYSKIPLSELERKEDEFIDNDHMQFLGENMVSQLFSSWQTHFHQTDQFLGSQIIERAFGLLIRSGTRLDKRSARKSRIHICPRRCFGCTIYTDPS